MRMANLDKKIRKRGNDSRVASQVKEGRFTPLGPQDWNLMQSDDIMIVLLWLKKTPGARESRGRKTLMMGM